MTKSCPVHAQPDHPMIPTPKVGILLANLGTPDNYDYWSMRRYLGEFLSDRRVIDYSPWLWQPLLQLIILTKRPFTSGAAYKSIWNEKDGESPLMTITKAQTAKIKETMQARYGDAVMVDFCMRYGNPSTKSKVEALVEAGCQKILFFPLYPHYAGATSATANDAFFAALAKEKWQPAARTVRALFRSSRLYRRLGDLDRKRLCEDGNQAGHTAVFVPRCAAALSDGGRPLSLPVPENDALA